MKRPYSRVYWQVRPHHRGVEFQLGDTRYQLGEGEARCLADHLIDALEQHGEASQ